MTYWEKISDFFTVVCYMLVEFIIDLCLHRNDWQEYEMSTFSYIWAFSSFIGNSNYIYSHKNRYCNMLKKNSNK